jgi:hypothetical protein
MLKIHLFRAGLIASIVLSAAAAFPAGAQAAAPTFHDKIHETIPDVDICGFVGRLRVTGSQVISFTDTRVKVTGQVTNVFTTGDGNTVTIKNAGQFTSTFRTSGDTITFVDTYKGLPEKISSRGRGGVQLRDAGVISFITTINLVTGEVTDEVVVKGPHPEAASGFTLFCDAVSAALT